MKKIVITGPESVGKTTLAETLALRLDAVLMPEYARSYVEALNRPYNYNDIEQIAKYQIEEETRLSAFAGKEILIMDTWLILTKVWFEIVYGSAPGWIESCLESAKIDLFLVCSPDLPWVADSVRENGGAMRMKLFDRYCREIEYFGFKYEIVDGIGKTRHENALKLLSMYDIG